MIEVSDMEFLATLEVIGREEKRVKVANLISSRNRAGEIDSVFFGSRTASIDLGHWPWVALL